MKTKVHRLDNDAIVAVPPADRLAKDSLPAAEPFGSITTPYATCA